jgi:FecR-like protein
MKKTKLCLGLCILFLIGFFPAAYAEPVGSLSVMKGAVRIRHLSLDNVYRDTEVTIPVHNGDIIHTGFSSRARIHFDKNGDDLEVYEKTFLTIDDVGGESDKLYMPWGKTRFTLKKAKKPSRQGKKRFVLRTVNALIGVKGTDFIVGTGDGLTSIVTISGVVDIANIEIPDIEIELTGNHATRVRLDKKPIDPIMVSPDAIKKIITSDSAKAFGEIPFEDDPAADQGKTSDSKQPIDVDELTSDIENNIDVVQEAPQGNQGSDSDVQFTIENP